MDPLSQYLDSSPLAMGLFLLLLGVSSLFGADHLADLQVRFGAGERERVFQTWVARILGVVFIVMGLYRLATHLL